VAVVAAVATGVTMGAGVVSVVLRHIVSRHIDAIERIPDQHFFDSIESLLRGSQVQVDTLKRIEQRIEDHELRLRALERAERIRT
jgi:hypothetical protein